MLYQDRLTGMLHEVPEVQGYGYGYAEDPLGERQIVYDGFGNPVGFSFRKAFSSIGKLVKKAAPFATAFMGPYGQIINRALPVVSRALTPVVRTTAAAIRQQAALPLPIPPSPQSLPQEALPELSGFHEGMMPYQAAPPMPYRAAPPMPYRAAPPMPYRAAPMTPYRAAPPPQMMRPRLPAGWMRPQSPQARRPPRRIYLRCAAWPGPRGLVPINAAQGVAPPPIQVPAAAPAATMGSRRGRRRRR